MAPFSSPPQAEQTTTCRVPYSTNWHRRAVNQRQNRHWITCSNYGIYSWLHNYLDRREHHILPRLCLVPRYERLRHLNYVNDSKRLLQHQTMFCANILQPWAPISTKIDFDRKADEKSCTRWRAKQHCPSGKAFFEILQIDKATNESQLIFRVVMCSNATCFAKSILLTLVGPLLCPLNLLFIPRGKS